MDNNLTKNYYIEFVSHFYYLKFVECSTLRITSATEPAYGSVCAIDFTVQSFFDEFLCTILQSLFDQIGLY